MTESSAPLHIRLQRVVVQMLFDPSFVDRVYGDAAGTLSELQIPERFLQQLTANDRRLWGADRLRARRALNTLIEEFKVSTALALAETRRLATLDDFFRSPEFHLGVQNRRYMALDFAAFLERLVRDKTLSWPATQAVLSVEGTMARLRRCAKEARRHGGQRFGPTIAKAAPGRYWVVRDGVGVAHVPAGTIEVIQHVERYLFECSLVPALALCDDAPRLDDIPPVDLNQSSAFLFETTVSSKVELSQIEDAFAVLIEHCASPISVKRLTRRAARAGIARERVAGLLEALAEAEALITIER